VPLKIKVFLWLVFKKCVLTRDVLKHRGREGTMCFCTRVHMHPLFEMDFEHIKKCELNMKKILFRF
jgi:hypothetical protein